MAILSGTGEALDLILPVLQRGEVVLFASPARHLAVPLSDALMETLRSRHRSVVVHTPAGSDAALDEADRNPARGRLNTPVQIVLNATQVTPSTLRRATSGAQGLVMHAVSWDISSAASQIARHLNILACHYSLALTVDASGQLHRAFPPSDASSGALCRGAAA
jgi:hypothetical protein